MAGEEKKREAIDALLEQPGVAEAARVAGMEAHVLHRWLQDPAFAAQLRAARRTHFRQQRARLRQGAYEAAKSVVDIFYRATKPANQLQAALKIMSLAEAANEIDQSAADVARGKGISKASRDRTAGHGAKSPSCRQKAITELVAQRSVAAAARTGGIGRQTLDRWLKEPAFDAELRATTRAVFGTAMALVQSRFSDAVTMVRKLSVNRAIPEQTRLKAAQYILDEAKANELEEQEASVTELNPADEGGRDRRTLKMLGRSCYQSLKRIKAGLQHAGAPAGIGRVVLVHAVDGRAAGTSVRGPAGRHIWLDPPAGCKAGEAVTDPDGPVQDAIT